MRFKLRPFSKLRVRRFSGLFWPIFDFFCGDSIRNKIQSPQKKSKTRLKRTPKSTEPYFRKRSIVIFCLLPLTLYARPGFHEPWGKDADLARPIQTQSSSSSPSLAAQVAEKIINFHQQVLSPVDGPRSHFRPSSSGYMKEAIQKYGFIKGFVMGCDRLLRENGDDWHYQKIESEGKLYNYDPVP